MPPILRAAIAHPPGPLCPALEHALADPGIRVIERCDGIDDLLRTRNGQGHDVLILHADLLTGHQEEAITGLCGAPAPLLVLFRLQDDATLFRLLTAGAAGVHHEADPHGSLLHGIHVLRAGGTHLGRTAQATLTAFLRGREQAIAELVVSAAAFGALPATPPLPPGRAETRLRAIGGRAPVTSEE